MLKQGTILKPDVRVRGDDPREVDRLVGPLLRGMAYEHLLLLLLDPVYRVKQIHVLGVGNELWVTCSIRKLFRTVLINRLHRFVVVHNHPGQAVPGPSVGDVTYARRLEEGADVLGLVLVDAIIIGEAGFFSMFRGGPGVSAPHPPEGGTEHGGAHRGGTVEAGSEDPEVHRVHSRQTVNVQALREAGLRSGRARRVSDPRGRRARRVRPVHSPLPDVPGPAKESTGSSLPRVSETGYEGAVRR